MALIKCPECGKEMSDKAPACPNCGCPISEIKAILNNAKTDDIDIEPETFTGSNEKVYEDDVHIENEQEQVNREYPETDQYTSSNIGPSDGGQNYEKTKIPDTDWESFVVEKTPSQPTKKSKDSYDDKGFIILLILSFIPFINLIPLIVGLVSLTSDNKEKKKHSIICIAVSCLILFWIVSNMITDSKGKSNVTNSGSVAAEESSQEIKKVKLKKGEKEMIDVTGMRYYDARSAIKEQIDEEAQITEVHEYSDTVEENNIVSTEPAAGGVYAKGQTITIHISDGKEKIMPDIVGMNIEAAKAKLQEVDFEVYVTEEYSEEAAGTVLRSEYEAGTNLNDKYGYVDVTVSKGTQEEEIQNIKDSAETPSYDDLMRYPESYKTKTVKLKVKITKIEDQSILGFSYDTAYWASYNGETLILYDVREVKEPGLRKGDVVTIYGNGNGMSQIDTKQKEYQGSLLLGFTYDKTIDTYEVPCVNFTYIELK